MKDGMRMGTGFRARHSLETIFDSQMAHAKAQRR